jgi:phosphoglycolate phosphatase
MKAPFRATAILFDLDGTLVDTAGDIGAALDALLVENGHTALGEATARGLVGDGARALIEKGWKVAGQPAPDAATLDSLTARWFEIYEADIARTSKPYPGVEATLAALRERGLKLGIVTNKADRPTAKLLKALGFEKYFGAVVGGDVPFRKPDPRHVRIGLAALGATPGETAFVGDSPNDAHSARAAGLPFIAVPYGYSLGPVENLRADVLVRDFAQIAELFV